MDKALLLVVDVQRGFVRSDETHSVVGRINSLVDRWIDKEWPIAYSRFVNLDGSNWQRLRDWHELTEEPDTLLAQELTVVPPYIFKKGTYSAWSQETAAVAATHHINDVVVVGVDTNECVFATAVAIFDAGLTPWVIEDCCASGGGQKPHDLALTLLRPLLGEQQVITSNDVLTNVNGDVKP